MERYLILLFVILFGVLSPAGATGFKHPGMLHTQEDFDRIKAQLEAGDETVTAAYARLTANSYASASYNHNPITRIMRGTGGGQSENYAPAYRDAAAAYQNALRWKISGSVEHAEKAIKIMNDWARVCVGIGGWTEASLASGIYGFEFANAAELMRDYPGWAAADFQKFKEWMLYVFYPGNVYFLKKRHGTHAGHYWANWGLCNVLAMMSIGILCDDVYIYNQGLSYYKQDVSGLYHEQTGDIIYNNSGYNEYILNLVPRIYEDDRGPSGYLGQMQEEGRDQGHALMCLGLAIDICQTAFNQGDDLFAYKNFRLASGIEHVAAFNADQTTELPWTTYSYTDNHGGTWVQTEISGGGSVGAVRPYWERIIGHYEGVEGLEMTFSRKMRSKEPVDGGGGNYGTTSGGFDHLGFSTLTCTRPAVTPDQAPAILIPSITYRDKTYAQANYSDITPGQTVKLSVELPEGISDTGNWQWETGETGKELEITANRSGVYRVSYINDEGVESVQLFTIAVRGDCSPDKITPVATVNGVESNDTIITVLRRASFSLAVQSAMGESQYKWNNNSTSSSITVENISSGRTYSVVCTNQGGHEQTINFTVLVLTSDKTIDDGDYFVVDAATGSYLSNDGTSVPRFSEPTVGVDQTMMAAMDSLVWVFTKDKTVDRYRIDSKTNGVFLDEYARFSENAYSSERNSYRLHCAEGTGLFAIQNGGSSGAAYWTIDNETITGEGQDSWAGFPFELISLKQFVGIDNLKSLKNYVYPNPMTDYLMVNVDENCIGNADFTLYSVDGRKEKQINCLSGKNTIMTGDLSKGLYVGILNTNDRPETFKVVKK